MIDRRLAQRVSVQWPVALQDRLQRRFFGQTGDISTGGVGVLVDRAVALALTPPNGVFGPQTSMVTVEMELDVSGGVVALQGQGRIRYSRRLSQQSYWLGIEFVQPSQEFQATLAVVLEQAQQHDLQKTPKPAWSRSS